MNALTKQYKDAALSINKTTVLVNAGGIAAFDKLLAMIADEACTLQEFISVVDKYEDDNIAEGKSAAKAHKVKAQADKMDSDDGVPDSLKELETMLRSMRESHMDKVDLDFENENVKKELSCRGAAKAIKTALYMVSTIQDEKGSVKGAELYANWKEHIGASLKAWVKLYANEHAECLARVKQLTAEG